MPPIFLFCPICNTTLTKPASALSPGADAERFDCPRCGPYALSGTAVATLNGLLQDKGGPGDWGRKKAAAVLSYRFRHAQREGEVQCYNSDSIKNILLNNELPEITERIDNFIIWLGNEIPEAGQEVQFKVDGPVMSVIGAISIEAIYYVVSAATDAELVVGDWDIGGNGRMTLTVQGWQRYAELRRGKTTSQTAFMAMKFGDPDLDAFVDDHLRSAVAATGFKLKRLDDDPRAGLIDDRLRVEIRNCRFLIADLSHGNKGAYWEAGYAEGLGKPVIYTCEKVVFDDLRNPERPHFDTNHHLTIVWEKGNLQDAADRLKATIRATLEDAKQLDASDLL